LRWRGSSTPSAPRDPCRCWRGGREQFTIRPPFFAPAELTVERAAAGLFGCPAYGVFVVGYIADMDNIIIQAGDIIDHLFGR
jgi:hypothetical protein